MIDAIEKNINHIKEGTLNHYLEKSAKEFNRALEKQNTLKDPLKAINFPFDEFQEKLDKNNKFHENRYEKLSKLILSWKKELETTEVYLRDLSLSIPEYKKILLQDLIQSYSTHFNIK